jgi:hypothetical protein
MAERTVEDRLRWWIFLLFVGNLLLLGTTTAALLEFKATRDAALYWQDKCVAMEGRARP